MNPTKSVANDIYRFVVKQKQTTAKDIQNEFRVSQVTIFKHLKQLIEEGKISKVGTPPKVVYYPTINFIDLQVHGKGSKLESEAKSPSIKVEAKTQKLLNEKFLYISASGFISEGFEGFIIWCNTKTENFDKTLKEYFSTWQKYLKFYAHTKHGDFIDASFKLKETFGEKTALDKLLYLDFYAIERFGKTKLAMLTFQAKQSQDIKLIDGIVAQTKNIIDYIIQKEKFNAIGFVPPTVSRKVQFMNVLERKLDLQLPKVEIQKIIYDTPVQQKTLKDKNDRIENAEKTFYIPTQKSYKKILLIDDFVGSGSTFNQIALKLKEKGIARKVYGLALTGSFKGFETINQI